MKENISVLRLMIPISATPFFTLRSLGNAAKAKMKPYCAVFMAVNR